MFSARFKELTQIDYSVRIYTLQIVNIILGLQSIYAL